MTITYQFDVATSSFYGFPKLLLKWRGSIYKLVYKEMLVYSAAFGLISATYRMLLDAEQRTTFELMTLYCARYLDLIPLSFVLGFYVTFVVQRWWAQFKTLPWPDRLMNTITLYVDGGDERGRLIRRTLMRYWNLSFVMILSSISIAVKKRFPTMKHIVEAGFMTVDEYQILDNVNTRVNKYWIPMTWFLRLLDQAKKEGRIKDGAPVKHVLEELNDTRSKMSLLWCHDWVTVPLVYTQVTTWATHLFFVACLFGRQYLDPSKKYPGHEIDIYIPIFTLLQFFFYLGWLKVAEQLINPFGEDDDDFETNWLIDRHIQVSYMGVDELYNKLPPIVKDLYWNSRNTNLPYTQASIIHRIPTYSGSTMHLKFTDREQPLLHNPVDPEEDDESVDVVVLERGPWQTFKDCLRCRKGNQLDNVDWSRVDTGILEKGRGRDGKMYFYPRTLGRKESLMADDLLATLNSGRRRSRMERVSSRANGFPHDYAHGNHDYPQDAYPMMGEHGPGGMGPSGHLDPHSGYVRRPQSHYLRQDSVESTFSTLHPGSGPGHGGSLYSLRPESPHVTRDTPSSRFYISEADEMDNVSQGPVSHSLIDGHVALPHVLTSGSQPQSPTRLSPVPRGLSRLSEVENETDGDYSVTTTPMTSPYATVVDPNMKPKIELPNLNMGHVDSNVGKNEEAQIKEDEET